MVSYGLDCCLLGVARMLSEPGSGLDVNPNHIVVKYSNIGKFFIFDLNFRYFS